MFHTLFSLTFEPFAVANARRAADCVRAADALVRKYLFASELPWHVAAEVPGWADVMRCFAYLAFTGMNNCRAYRICYWGRLAAWAAVLGNDGLWPRLSRNDALRRIGLMNRDSYLFPDGGYETEVRRAYEHYVKHFEYSWESPTVDSDAVRELGLLYGIVVQGNLWSVDEALLDRVDFCHNPDRSR